MPILHSRMFVRENSFFRIIPLVCVHEGKVSIKFAIDRVRNSGVEELEGALFRVQRSLPSVRFFTHANITPIFIDGSQFSFR